MDSGWEGIDTCSDRGETEHRSWETTARERASDERPWWRHKWGWRAVTLAVERGFVPCTRGAPAVRLGPAEIPSLVQARLHKLETPDFCVSSNVGRTTTFTLPKPSLGPYAENQTELGCIVEACPTVWPPDQSRNHPHRNLSPACIPVLTAGLLPPVLV